MKHDRGRDALRLQELSKKRDMQPSITTWCTCCTYNTRMDAHDVEAGSKHEIAKELLRNLWVDRAGMPDP